MTTCQSLERNYCHRWTLWYNLGMSTVEVPSIDDFAGRIVSEVGADVTMYIHFPDKELAVLDYRVAEEVVHGVFAAEGIEEGGKLDRLCNLIARISIKRIAAADKVRVFTNEDSYRVESTLEHNRPVFDYEI